MTSGNRNAQAEQGSWNIPGSAPNQGASGYAGPPAAADGVRGRGRPGLVALIVALVELVVIAAVCNQAVVKHTQRYFFDHQNTFLGRAAAASLQFGWRVSPTSSDNRNGFHFLYSQLVVIAVFVVLSALLAAVAVRGPVTFGRALLGIWTGAIAAACVGRIVGALVTKSVDNRLGRGTAAVFESINSLTFVAAAVVGLIAAIVGALFAVATRRRVEAPAYAPPPAAESAYTPEAPPPFYGRQGADPRDAAASGRDPRAESDTAALPTQSGDGGEHATRRLPDTHDEPSRGSGSGPREEPRGDGQDAGDNRTTQIPRFDPRGGQHWTPPEDEGQSTQAMPNAPDDGRH